MKKIYFFTQKLSDAAQMVQWRQKICIRWSELLRQEAEIMISVEIPEGLDKVQRYRLISVRLQGIAASEKDSLACLCNFMAFLYWTMGDVSWVGLYIRRGGDLVLGPFCGKPACSRIAMGKGVCGTAAETQRVQIVPDVSRFPGHIACDSASRSEIVFPLFADGQLWGVLDIDSPVLGRFDESDKKGLEPAAEMIEKLAAALDKKTV
jgi:GAF domain-containing protein